MERPARNTSRRKRGALLLLAVLLGAGACGEPPNGLWIPHTPSPVMLGPVDRVGGHTRAPTPALAHVTAATTFTVVAGDSEAGDPVVAGDGRAGMTTLSILRATGGDPAKDVRVTSLRASAWVLWGLFFNVAHERTTLGGDVVQSGAGGAP